MKPPSTNLALEDSEAEKEEGKAHDRLFSFPKKFPKSWVGLPRSLNSKESAYKSENMQVQSLGWEDPPEKEKWQPTSVFFVLGNPMDKGVWQATVYGVSKELDMT